MAGDRGDSPAGPGSDAGGGFVGGAAGYSPGVSIDVSESSFAAQVLERSRTVPVVVDFWATWCGPCRVAAPVVDQFARQRSGELGVLKLDTDANSAAAGAHRIRGIPTFLLFEGGREVARQSGAMSLPMLNQFAEGAALAILRAVRRRNKKIPIFLIADRTLVSELPLEVVKQVHEYIHLFGDTPAFIANRVDFAVERYHEQLLPPYFRELKKYTDQGAYSWDAPGHMGGVAFLKHPVGMEFHKFFGENIMRSDLGISTSPLGSWLDHLGPPGESERNARRKRPNHQGQHQLRGQTAATQLAEDECGKEHRRAGEQRQHQRG